MMLNKKLEAVLCKLDGIKNQWQDFRAEEFSSVQPYLPVKTQDDFKHLSEKLASDPDFEKLMVSFVIFVVG